MLTALSLLIAAMLLDLAFPLPLPDTRGAGGVVVARDGTPLRAFADRGGVWRHPTTPEQVSPLYLQALIGYEDRWFWSHPGINPVALGRAAWQWLRNGHVVSGGSTLTMQVARLLDPQARADSGRRSVWGKLRQLARAVQLEVHLSKREILVLYLDRAPFPAFARIARDGLRARRMIPVYPSNTFPGHVANVLVVVLAIAERML